MSIKVKSTNNFNWMNYDVKLLSQPCLFRPTLVSLHSASIATCISCCLMPTTWWWWLSVQEKQGRKEKEPATKKLKRFWSRPRQTGLRIDITKIINRRWKIVISQVGLSALACVNVWREPGKTMQPTNSNNGLLGGIIIHPTIID